MELGFFPPERLPMLGNLRSWKKRLKDGESDVIRSHAFRCFTVRPVEGASPDRYRRVKYSS